MSPSSLQLCSFQSCGSDVSSTTLSPACWVQHLSTFKTISLHGTDDWERCIISSPVVNKSGYDDIHVSVIKSQCPLVGHVDRYMPVIKSSNSLLIMYKTAFVILGSSKMWHCVVRCVIPHVSKDYSASTFRVTHSSPREMIKALSSFKMLASTWPCRWRHQNPSKH